ncbi:MAG: restriction endonuclease subunit S, partial [Bacteroidales bacterium]|nr:restriction endonuclease subunit S [Bacteroidales bacterium]
MTKVRFDQIAKEVRNTFSGDKAGVPIVGLEHIIPNELLLSDHDIDTENTFTKAFKKGQILFGRRRAYQQKAAVATFDGICSGDITVIEPLNGAVCPELLPFIIQNERFFEHAVRGSAGSLSPRVKWEHLASYEIELPSYEEQVKLANELWAAYNLKTSYKTLLVSIDEMVKSQFIEMFSDVPKVGINTLVDTIWGSSPDSKTYNDTGEGVPFYQGKTEFGDLYINAPVTFCTAPVKMAKANAILMSVRAPVGAVNIATQDCCIGRGLASITPKEGKSTAMFIYYALKYMEEDIDRLGTGSTFKAINKESYAKIQMPNAEISDQTKFVSIAEQADKSKF